MKTQAPINDDRRAFLGLLSALMALFVVSPTAAAAFTDVDERRLLDAWRNSDSERDRLIAGIVEDLRGFPTDSLRRHANSVNLIRRAVYPEGAES